MWKRQVRSVVIQYYEVGLTKTRDLNNEYELVTHLYAEWIFKLRNK